MCTTMAAAYGVKTKVEAVEKATAFRDAKYGGSPSSTPAASQTATRIVSDPVSTPIATSTSAATPQPLMAKKIITTGRTMLGGAL